jgi:DNA-binding MarR family transcriptional regulator
MKNEFIEFVKALMAAAPEVHMSDEAATYFEALCSTDVIEKEEITENGKTILEHMQKSEMKTFKAKDIAEDLFISSRAVSGSLRKLVNDGFAEKIGQNPVIYTLTEKGKNYNI